MTRKLLSSLLASFLVVLPFTPPPATAQIPQVTTITPNTFQRTTVATINGNVTTTFEVPVGPTRHQIQYQSGPAVTAVTFTVNAKTSGAAAYSLAGASAQLSDTITFYGPVASIQIVTTGFTGSGAIDATYFGDTVTSQLMGLTGTPFNTQIGAVADALKTYPQGPANGGPVPSNPIVIAGSDGTNVRTIATDTSGDIKTVPSAGNAGQLVTITAASGATTFSTSVMGSAISVGTTTVAPFGTTTTLVQGLLVNNICSTAVQVTVADGNNNPIVGSETSSGGSFSIPAMSNLALNMGIVGHVLTSGLKTSAVNTNNCILLWVEGKQ